MRTRTHVGELAADHQLGLWLHSIAGAADGDHARRRVGEETGKDRDAGVGLDGGQAGLTGLKAGDDPDPRESWPRATYVGGRRVPRTG